VARSPSLGASRCSLGGSLHLRGARARFDGVGLPWSRQVPTPAWSLSERLRSFAETPELDDRRQPTRLTTVPASLGGSGRRGVADKLPRARPERGSRDANRDARSHPRREARRWVTNDCTSGGCHPRPRSGGRFTSGAGVLVQSREGQWRVLFWGDRVDPRPPQGRVARAHSFARISARPGERSRCCFAWSLSTTLTAAGPPSHRLTLP
jgi:hypothetical protein